MSKENDDERIHLCGDTRNRYRAVEQELISIAVALLDVAQKGPERLNDVKLMAGDLTRLLNEIDGDA